MNKRKNLPDTQVKDFKKSITNLFKSLKSYYGLIIISLILAMFAAILSIIGPDKISVLTNTILKGITGNMDLDKIKSVALFLLIIYLLSLIFNYFEGCIMTIVSNKYSKGLRNSISSKINRLPLKYFDGHAHGDILSRVTNDVDLISQSLDSCVSSLVSAITLFIGVIFMMFKTNWIMAITAIFSTIFGFAFMIIVLFKSQKYFDAFQKELGNINGHIEEAYSGHSVIKCYNAENEVNKKFDSINDKLCISARKSQFLSGLMGPMMGFIGNFGFVCVCVVGALLSLNNKIDMGSIVSFMIYVRLFSSPLSTFAQAANQLQSASAASERIFEFLDEKEMNTGKTNKYLDKNAVKGNIEFDHVKFGYDDNKIIIKDFSCKVKPGQKIAIVGPTGAGKTTMVNLLMKFYEVNSGNILIDGVSIKELTRENVHDLFIMVLQDTWLFNGSVKDNLVYNTKNVTDEEIKNACRTVGVDHFIKTLPKGYNTILNDQESISSGQKQLLTIARGMIKNAPFLILDEATSSVDTRTEELVQSAMDKLTKGRTSFIIAHRLSTIKNADLILVMKDGNIIETGNHEELIKKNGFYADLYNSQFQN